jgi:hypothetical protein
MRSTRFNSEMRSMQSMSVHVSSHCFPDNNFVWCYETTREQTTRWAKLTVRQLSQVLKIAPSAGLFRPTAVNDA